MKAEDYSLAFPVHAGGESDAVPSCWSVIEPGDRRYKNAYVPSAFQSMVLSHAVCTLRGNLHRDYVDAPVFLVIVGPPGIGKTYQTIASASTAGLRVFYCSASKLTGDHLGESADRMSNLYAAASKDVEKREGFPIILIDDFHLGEAAVSDKMETTVNSNILTSRLMNICDEADLARIPIVLTANRLDDVEPALLRDGRTRVFPWSPTTEDIRKTVAKAYGSMGINPEVAYKILDDYKERTVAFYCAIAEEAKRLAAADSLNGHSFEDLVLNKRLISEISEEHMVRAARILMEKDHA